MPPKIHTVSLLMRLIIVSRTQGWADINMGTYYGKRLIKSLNLIQSLYLFVVSNK